ncbi:MAG: type II toxin-antitoxin system VapC family toxin [Actinomycetes bacterium]
MPVVDASVVVDWVAPGADPEGPARRLLDELASSGARLIGPRLLLEEVSNALLTGCRRGRWDGAATDRAFALLRELPVELLDGRDDLDRAWELSRRYDEHPVYDMVYVALAERLEETLMTADEALVRRLTLLDFVALVR